MKPRAFLLFDNDEQLEQADQQRQAYTQPGSGAAF